MEATTIKDLILTTLTAEEKKTTKKAPRKLAEYEVVTVSGPDFAVRKKGTTTSYLLVCICSMNQFYIKNEKTGENEVLDSKGLSKFLGDVPADKPLEIIDNEGKTPFWINCLERGKDFSENFMAMIGSETLRVFFCKDMISFADISSTVEYRRKQKYSSIISDKYESLDFKRVKFIFDQIAEFVPRSEVKTGFGEFIYHDGYRIQDSKLGSLFNELLDESRRYYSYRSYATTKSLYNWLTDNWGVEGVKQFIKAYLENPVAYVPYTLVQSETIQNCQFVLSDFLDYCFCECTRQGYANDPDNFIQSWSDYLNAQIYVYGKIQDKYSEHLATDEQILSYKVAKLREAEQVQNFSEAANRMKLFEGESGKYIFIAPKTPRDLIEEGQRMSNCVASYIDRVANGESMVFFMRKKADPEHSLVTIEVRDGRLVQVKARFNKRPTAEQEEAAQAWFDKTFARLSMSAEEFLGL